MSSSKLSANILSLLGSASPSPKTTTKEKEVKKAKYVTPTDADVIAKNRKGLVVVRDGLMGETLCREAFIEAENIFKKGKLQQAGMGKQSKVDTSYRGDSIVWLTSEDDVVNETKALKRILKNLTDIRDELIHSYKNKLSLTKRISVQLARYPANSLGYVRHTDVRPEDSKLGMFERDISLLISLLVSLCDPPS